MERKTGLMNKKYVSPCFLPGMRLGNIMFTLAAACAHARTVGVECRVPWAYNDASLMLRSRLGGWVLPSTPCGTILAGTFLFLLSGSLPHPDGRASRLLPERAVF